MRLRRARGDPEAPAHFVVRAPGCDQLDHLPLTVGDRRVSPCQRLGHGATLLAPPPAENGPNGVFRSGYAGRRTARRSTKLAEWARAFASASSDSSRAPI